MRDDFTKKTRETLAKRVQYFCSLEECGAATVGPADNTRGFAMVGVAAHITAASKNGPRYDSKLTRAQRRAETNGIWLCHTHSEHIDDDLKRFTVAMLRAEKKRAEDRARRRVARPTDLTKKPLVLLSHDTLKSSIDTATVADLPGLLQGRDLQRVSANFVQHLEHEGTTQAALNAVARSMVTESGAVRSCLSDPRTDVLYFGFPHVPFGVLAGCIAGSQRHVHLVEHDRSSGRFRWPGGPEAQAGQPAHLVRSTGNCARLLVSVSAVVDQKLCDRIVPARRSKIDLRVGLETPYRGAIVSESQARQLVDEIAHQVDSLLGGRSDIEAVHVFAAVPVSVAFLLGQRIFAGTALPPVVVHSLTATPRPAYRWGLNLADALAGRRATTIHGD